MKEFGNYKFGINYNSLEPDKVYIIKDDMKQNFISEGYKIVNFENYSVASKNE